VAAKTSPRFQSPMSSTAGLRATAVRAFFGPIRFMSRSPRLRSADGCRTVVGRRFAAS